MIIRGISDTGIERHPHLSRGAVGPHIGRLLTKLSARDRARLVIVGHESGPADR
ncbi:hypothetical protein ACSNN9_27245 [Micromonospora sp. URMC 107]|uniref:hypothetical protein n=1 Tax=Micromonospora sp. URMC 107 TaxID=3423418 RepID=UPI003F1BC766